MPQLVVMEVTIRNNGRYNYRYVMGKHIKLYSGYTKTGYYSHYPLEDNERIDFIKNSETFPATFWATDPRKAEKKLLNLEVTDIRINRAENDYLYRKDYDIGWELMQAYITCDIGNESFNGKCTKIYEEKPPQADIEKDQMSIEDFLEG